MHGFETRAPTKSEPGWIARASLTILYGLITEAGFARLDDVEFSEAVQFLERKYEGVRVDDVRAEWERLLGLGDSELFALFDPEEGGLGESDSTRQRARLVRLDAWARSRYAEPPESRPRSR